MAPAASLPRAAVLCAYLARILRFARPRPPGVAFFHPSNLPAHVEPMSCLLEHSAGDPPRQHLGLTCTTPGSDPSTCTQPLTGSMD